ncbi:MAG: hypothetical protein QXF76_00430 [Candidatus Anstonellales archaeon]
MNKEDLTFVRLIKVLFLSSILFQSIFSQDTMEEFNLSRPETIKITKIGQYSNEQNVNYGQIIDAGKIAPGQVLEIAIMQRVFTKGKFDIGGTYDKVKVENLPKYWTVESLSGFNPVSVKIKLPRFASDGIYNFTIKLIDEEHLDYLDDFVFHVQVQVDKNIIELHSKDTYVGNAQENIEIDFSITNIGTYPESFTIELYGPKLSKIVYSDILLQPNEKRVFRTIQRFGEAVDYDATIYVYSQNSDIVSVKKDIKIVNRRTLTSDVLSTKNGILLFPLNWMHSFWTYVAHLLR